MDLARRGDRDAALARLSNLLTLEPEHAAGWALQGAIHMGRGRPRDALPAYDRAVSLGDDDPRTHMGRGLALLEFERNAEAAPSFERAVAGDPSLLRAHIGLARALCALGHPAQALGSAEAALALKPTDPDALRWRGRALNLAGDPAAALAAFQAIAPTTAIQRADMLADIGMAHEGLGQYDAALAAYDEAVTVAPDARMAVYRRGFLRLLRGDFPAGWADYESRWRRRHAPLGAVGQMTPAFRDRLVLAPSVADLAGRNVLVVGEQGIGDMVMFASLLPDLCAVAARVVCIVEHRLQTLFAVSFPDIEVVAGAGPDLIDLSRIDLVVAIGSLPHAFRQASADFPGRPYLRPLPDAVDRWRQRLAPAEGRRRIGISWQGGMVVSRRAARSMSLDTLRPLLERPDLQFVSVQYGDVAAEIAAVNATLPRPIEAFPPAEIDDFHDLAGLVLALDAVVTVQTAVGHLTGALGRPGLVMVPLRPEWRYGLSGPRMPWYASLRLFRQTEAGAWADVIARVSAALDEPR